MQASAQRESLEERADYDLYDVVDSALVAMHQQSEDNAAPLAGLLNGVDVVDRRRNMEWLMRAFESVHFSDAALFQSALVLDRFYAARPHRDTTVHEAQQTLLAAVILAVKVDTRDDYPMKLSQIVAHLGQKTVPFEAVLQAEAVMLPYLRYCIGTPTAYDFLEVLVTRVELYHPLVAALSEYLLQLTLADVRVHWGFPHSVLAASVLAMAALTLQAPPEAVTVILEDLRVLCPTLEEQQEQECAQVMARCCADLHTLWVQSVSQPTSDAWPFAQYLRAKFEDRSHRHREVLAVQPPTNPPVAVQV